jgi:ketosteroid isomerase-like protein
MKRASVPLAVLACAALLACHAGVGGHLSEADKDKIRKVVDEGMRTVNPPTSDVEAYVKLYYAEDARALPPNHAVRFTILAVEGRNDLAYVHGGYQLSVTPPGAAEAVGDTGKYVEIWKKQGDGTWKVVLDIFNSDLAAPVSPPPPLPALTPPAHD